MDWLGGLSNIKGQISSLTKDLLAEGTSELTDPKSELDLARAHISELEFVIESQKNEISSLKTKNDELQVQLESAELRLDHAREQFQVQLKEKEAIIVKLRSEVAVERGEPEGQSAASSKISKVDIKQEAMGRILPSDSYFELASEDHETICVSGGDGTATWQELKNEVVELRAEVARWRRIAKQKKANDRRCSNLQNAVTQELEKEIDELKQKLMDTEELRQAEITTLRDTHSEQMSNLLEQLREAETEVLSLRDKLEEAESKKEVTAPPASTMVSRSVVKDGNTELPPSPGPDRITKKKQRPMKKRKQKVSIDSRPEGAEITQITPEPPVEKTYKETGVQCLLLDFSTDTSTDFEKVDAPSSGAHTPTSDVAQTEKKIPTTAKTVGVQRETESKDSQVQTDADPHPEPEIKPLPPVDTDSVGVQTLALASPSDESSNNESLINASGIIADDGRSQISDVSDISVSSRNLDDLVHQLAEEVQSYELVVDEVVHTVTKRLPSRSNQPGSSGLDVDDITQKLAMFQASLKQRRDRLATIRKRNRNKLAKTEDTQPIDREVSGLSTLSEVVYSRPSSPVVPLIETSMTSEPTDPNEAESDGWHDEDLYEFNSAEPRMNKTRTSVSSRGDDKKTQTMHRSESSETIVSDLRNTIHELEARLSADTEAYRTRVEELEEMNKPAQRLQQALSLAVQHLAAALPGPPPLPPGSPSLCKELSPPPLDWPPKNPEAQLALLVALERAGNEQVQRLRAELQNTQEALNSLSQENESLHRRLDEHRAVDKPPIKVEEPVDVKQEAPTTIQTSLEDEDMSVVAHRLCLALDPEYNEEVWDPDQWDYLLYEVLKTRFDENPTETFPVEMDPSSTADERVLKLSAEVAALRDILGQHAAFRSQAEHDLRQLLTTVGSQRAQLEELTHRKDQLEQELALAHKQSEQPIHSRQDDSDELSRAAIQQLSELVREKEDEIERLKRCCEDLKQLIRSAHGRVTGTASDMTAPSETANDDDVTTVLERLTQQWSEAKTRADRVEAMYESVLSALEQKHAESQSYHAELQRVYADLSSSSERCEALQQEVTDLREKLFDVTSQNLSLKTQTLESETDRTEINRENVIPVTATIVGTAEPPSSNVDSKEAKLMAEIERLRAHLLEMEESYTAEALNAESREVDLRSQLHHAHERLTQLEESSQTAEQRVSHANMERDEARQMNLACQKEIAALKNNLANLQSVLDSFQQNQQSAVTAETEHIRLELHRVQQNETSLKSQLDHLTNQLADRDQLEERTHQLMAQIQRHNSQVDRIRAQVDERDKQIESLQTRLAQMAVDTDSKIDKILMKNLLLSYFQLPSSQKENGLRVIGSLLHFTDEEYKKAGSNFGAIPTLLNWMRNAVSSLPAGPPKDVTFASSYPDKSFTELFLAFLEQEAGLRAPLKLSMDYYTPEAVRSGTTASRRPSQPTIELENPHSTTWSSSSVMTPSSATSVPVRVPEWGLPQSNLNRDLKAPLNPLFQM